MIDSKHLMKAGVNIVSEKGMALGLVITVTLITFLMAAAVLNFTYGRFHLSAFQSDHMAAFYATEAGVRYAFARLETDTAYEDPNFQTEPLATRPPPGFANAVRHAYSHHGQRAYVVTSLRTGEPTVDGGQVNPDARTDALFMGQLLPNGTHGNGKNDKEVTVWIQAKGGNPEFRVRAFSDYGLRVELE